MKRNSPKLPILFAFLLWLAPILSKAQYDVALSLATIASSPVKYNTSVPFVVTVYNQSTSQTVQNVDIIVRIKPGFVLNPANNSIWSSDPVIANAFTTRISTPIDPLSNNLVTINLLPVPGQDSTLWDISAEIFSVEDINGNVVNNLDPDSPHDKNNTNDAGGLIGAPSDNAINGNGTGTPGSASAASDEDDHDVAFGRIFDLAMKKLLVTAGPHKYGDTLVFTTTVYNQGNETTGQCFIQELLTEGYIWDAAANASLGWSGAPPKPRFAFSGLKPLDSLVIPVKLVLSSNQFDDMAWNNYTEVLSVRDASNTNVSANEADSSPNSNSLYENSVLPGSLFDNQIFGNGPSENEDEDDHDVAAPRIFDLAIKKERQTSVPSYSYTQNVTYTITLYNQGNVIANSVTVEDTIPCGLEFLPAINPNWTLISPRKIRYVYNTSPLLGATSTTFNLIFGVNPCYDDPSNGWTNYIEISSAVPADGGLAVDIDGRFDSSLNNDFQYNNLSNDNVINLTSPNQDEDNHDLEKVQVVDVALKKLLVTPPPYSYGQNLDFNIRVFNQGNIPLVNVKIKDYIPLGYDYISTTGWNMADTTYTVPTRLNPGDSLTIPINLRLKTSTGRRDWFNYAHVINMQDTVGNDRFDDADSFPLLSQAEFLVEPGSPADNNIFVLGPPNSNVDEDDHDPAGFLVFDLRLDKSVINPKPSYKYGDTVTYQLLVINEGGSAASNAEVIDYIPCGFTFSPSINPGWTTSGSNVRYAINTGIPANDTVILNIKLIAAPCSNPSVRSWLNKAEISSATDAEVPVLNDMDSTPDNNPNNDSANEDDIDSVNVKVFDLSLDKKLPAISTGLAIGSSVTYTFDIKNEGNTTASNVVVRDYLPCGLSFGTAGNPGWSLSGSDVVTTISTIAPGQTVSLSLSLTIVSCNAANAYRNIAEITNANDGNTPGNDADSTPDTNPNNDPPTEDDHDIETITVSGFDLALDKVIANIPANYTYGSTITYNIVVTNQGQSTASNVTVIDYLKCGYTFNAGANPGWTQVGSNVTYNINTPINPNGSVTVPLNLVLTYCANTASKPYSNKAEISNSPQDNDSTPDTNPNNDLPGEDDIDSTDLVVYDIALNKIPPSNTSNLRVGSQVTFNMAVTNEGNVAASNVVITDYLPCGYSFSTAGNNGWSQSGSNVNYTIPSLAVGATQQIPLTLTIIACARDTALKNIAEITGGNLPNGNPGDDVDSNPDTNPYNDPASEDDHDIETLNIFDLAIEKNVVNLPTNYTYGSVVRFNILVANQGTQAATNIGITDYLRCGYSFVAASNPGWSQVGSTLKYTITSSIAPGAIATVPLDLVIQSCATTNNTWRNRVEISTSPPDGDSTPDDNPNNDPPGEDDIDSTGIDVFDLSLDKVVLNPAASYNVGQNITFNIVVRNEGNVNATNVLISDYMPCGFTFSAASNAGWSINTTTNNLSYTIPTLNVGQTLTIPVNLVIANCSTAGSYTNRAEISGGNGPNGPGRDVDSTPDTNPNNDLPAEDDSDGETIVVNAGTLGGNVWNDTNGNGIQDPGESFTSGITVQLFDCQNNLLATTTTTAPDGAYSFTGLAAGSYIIRVLPSSLPANSMFTTQNVPPNDQVDSDVSTSGNTACINLGQNETNLTNDAGYVIASNIGDFVWNDVNGNGTQDGSEVGVPNVQVLLYTSVNVLVQSTTTNASGNYLFNNVTPGNYYIQFVKPSQFEFSDPNVGSNDNVDSDVVTVNGNNGRTAIFAFTSGNNLSFDAGLFICTKVGQLVWYDIDKDDIHDPNENGINGLKMSLFRQINGAFTLYEETFTGQKPGSPSDDGYFEFCVPPGVYYIKANMPPVGLVQARPNVLGVIPIGQPNEQTTDSDLTNANGPSTTPSFTVISGQNIMTIGAGFYPMATAGNLVWEDSNTNGIQDQGEPRVASVLVEAFDINNDKIGQDVTDNEGTYTIDYLGKESYYLRFTPPTGYGMTMSNISTEETDSDVDHTNGLNTTSLFAFSPGQTNTNIDAGLAFGVLPVKYRYLQAEALDKVNKLDWETEIEINSEKFYVQRFDDNTESFVTIGEVKAAGNSTRPMKYTFEDEEVKNDGYYTYRLEQVDFDGSTSISNQVQVYRKGEDKVNTSIYPNPASEKFFISMPTSNGIVEVSLFDASGSNVSKKIFASSNTLTYPIQGLAKGLYNVTIKYDGKEENHKLIIVE